ncbi:MAG TPA: MltA domain-containing protein [Xanthobacteraceae bacterium]|nr:MltA domain-containing protein [Xanthobacteraceae bacterium]
MLTAATLAATTLASAEGRDPMRIADTQYETLDWSAVDGWADDDHAAAFATFLKSCRAILRSTNAAREGRPMRAALYQVCGRAVAAKPSKPGEARAFFEKNFRPIHISPLGSDDGFLTGYYEPIVTGARHRESGFDYPLYRKPSNLLPGGRMLVSSVGVGKKKAHRRKLVPFHARAAIDDGVLAGRDLEICWLKDPIDAFFAHIQGSVRVLLDDGRLMRLNYQAANGHPYYAVGRDLIERGIVPKDEMSMDRIRQWMERHPKEGEALRRKNKSYVFFRETRLANDEEPLGAQGVSLTPGRSIAVDRNLHVYGTPFFISAMLPIQSEQPTTPFRRLMIAQDTGGAIVGPARADIYFGAGDEAGSISGRLRHPGRFVMLLPRELDPGSIVGPVPLPLPRPSTAVIAGKHPAVSKTAAAETVVTSDAKPSAKTPEGPAKASTKVASKGASKGASKTAAKTSARKHRRAHSHKHRR